MTLTDREYQTMRDVGDRRHPRRGGRHRGLQHPVRRRPCHRSADRHRDEPAGVAVVGAGLEGDRLPDREDRRQARRGLLPRRDPQRHHGSDAGVLRAGSRLRRRQGSAVRLREVPAGRPDADHHHEVGRRGDGHRPQLHRGSAEGAALPRAGGRGLRVGGRSPRQRMPLLAQAALPRDGRLRVVQQALYAGATVDEVHAATGIDPWFLDQIELVNEVAADVRAGAELAPHVLRDRQAARVLRPAGGRAARHHRDRDPRGAPRPRHPAGLQDRRHLRSGVRGDDALPLLVLRRGDRGGAAREAGGADPRQWPQPDRAGDRVRLLVRARRDDAARGRLRDRDGQLQPRDGVHRLRHQRPALLRAAHPRGRPRGLPRRAHGRSGRRRDRPARRPDPARAGAGAEGRRRAHRRHDPRSHPPGRGARRLRPRARRGRAAGPQARHRDVLRRGQGDRRHHRLPGAGAAVVRARRSGHGDRLRRGDARRLHRAGHADQP